MCGLSHLHNHRIAYQVRGEWVGGGACGYGEYAWVGGHTCMCVCGWRVNIMLELYIDYTGRFEWLYSHFKFLDIMVI